MGMFQALLLAASLGWNTVVVVGALPQASSTIPSLPSGSATFSVSGGPPRVTRFPHTEISQHHLDIPSSTPPNYASPVTEYTQSSLLYDHGHSPTGPPPHQSGGQSTLPTIITPPQSPPPPPPNTGPPGHPPPQTPSPPAGTTTAWSGGTASGGILYDTNPPPTAIRTYFVSGHPVVAGAPATVVGGTTWKFPASGTKLYADGTATAVSDAIIGGASATASGSGSRVVAPSGSAGAAGTNGGAIVRVSGALVLVVGGAVGVGMGLL